MDTFGTITFYYELTPITLRLSYFLWMVFLSLYWFAHKYDKYHSKISPNVYITKTPNFNWIFPFSGILLLSINQILILCQFGFNDFILSLKSLEDYTLYKLSKEIYEREETYIMFNYITPWFGIFLMCVGLYIAGEARAMLNGYWNTSIIKYKKGYGRLVRKGIYSKMRHPIYFAQFLLALGSAFASQSFLVFLFPIILYRRNAQRALKEDEALERNYKRLFLKYKELVPRYGFKI